MDDWRVLPPEPETFAERTAPRAHARNAAIIATRMELDQLAEEAWQREPAASHLPLALPNGERHRETGRKSATPDPRLVLLGRYLRRSRRIVGMSQQRIADLTGVSQSTISRVERGNAPSLGLDRLVALVSLLGRAFPVGVCPHEHTCPWQPIADPPPSESRIEEFVARALARILSAPHEPPVMGGDASEDRPDAADEPIQQPGEQPDTASLHADQGWSPGIGLDDLGWWSPPPLDE